MGALIQCVYSSSATARFRESELPDLLAKSRIANSARGITGMLVYINGHFLQVIEGQADVIDSLLLTLKRDPGTPVFTRSFASLSHTAALPIGAWGFRLFCLPRLVTWSEKTTSSTMAGACRRSTLDRQRPFLLHFVVCRRPPKAERS